VTLEAVYADGWNDAVVNPLTPGQARARDAAGDPYAVLLLADGRLHALLHVSWQDDYCHVSRFDARGRRIATYELRRTRDGDLSCSSDSLVERRFILVESGAMVAWSSGWDDGAYPTWIGRDAGGEVVCFLADMLLFGPYDNENDKR
jgi:hypothetical protein